MKHVKDMLSRTADGAMLADEHGIVVLWNQAAERLLGFQALEVIGRPCHEVMRGETLSGQPFCSPACAVGRRLGCGGGVRNFDLRTRTKDGRVVWLNVSSLPVPSRKQDRFLFAHLFRDITKRMKIAGLAEALYALLAAPGGHPVPGMTRQRVAGDPPGEMPEIPRVLPLTERERDILRQLATGKSSKEIADSLVISPVTVRNHIQHILEKLGAHSRLQALAIAFPPGGAVSRK
jgi:PAS domain S-box-containing protein